MKDFNDFKNHLDFEKLHSSVIEKTDSIVDGKLDPNKWLNVYHREEILEVLNQYHKWLNNIK